MDTIDVSPNQKGAIGEVLVLHGRTTPYPISDAIESFVEQAYDVADNTQVEVSNGHAMYLNVSTGDGEKISTRSDGAFKAQWVPKEKSEEIVWTPDGHVQNVWTLASESALFPVEVKTGKYAELERDQKDVLETVAGADTRDHPMIVRVNIEKLPEQYDVSVRIL